MQRGREKGCTKSGGRAKGIPNKVTATLRDAIMHAFDSVGGENYLEMVAKKHPQIFCMLLAKIIPVQLTGKDDGPVKTETTIIYSGIFAKLDEKA